MGSSDGEAAGLADAVAGVADGEGVGDALDDATVAVLEGVAEEDGGDDLVGGQALACHGVGRDHGTLRVAAEDELCVGALGERGLRVLGHLGTAGGAELGVACDRGGVVGALHGDLVGAELGDETLGNGWADGGAQVAGLSSAAGEEEGVVGALAALVDVVGGAA